MDNAGKNNMHILSVEPLNEEKNAFILSRENASDSQKKRETERRLKHSESRLNQAQAIAHIGSWELDMSTGIVKWSEELCRIYGVESTEKLQTYQSWLSFIHPEDLEQVKKTSKEAHEKLLNFSFHHRIITADGFVRYIFSKAQFEFDEFGAAIYLNGIGHDITETKLAEQALLQSEANLRLIVDLLPQNIFVKDENGVYGFVNKNFASIYGLTPQEMTGKNLKDLAPAKTDFESVVAQDKEVIATGTNKFIPEIYITDCNGNKRVFQSLKVPYTPVGSATKMVLGIADDITFQKRADIERASMMADILQRNKNLEKFSYIVSHNLRAPVANIMGLADVLQIPELSRDDKEDFVRKLSACADNLNNIVVDLNDILQIDRKESNKMEWVKLGEILNEVEHSFKKIIKNEQVQIITDFSADTEVYSIRNYLYSIFFHLISNSIKYRQQGIAPVIEISFNKTGNQFRLIFKDNGIGINLERKGDEVFGLYKRFHFHVDGKGMGLYMVKAQVESLGGTITVSSNVNKGSEFQLVFTASQN